MDYFFHFTKSIFILTQKFSQHLIPLIQGNLFPCLKQKLSHKSFKAGIFIPFLLIITQKYHKRNKYNNMVHSFVSVLNRTAIFINLQTEDLRKDKIAVQFYIRNYKNMILNKFINLYTNRFSVIFPLECVVCVPNWYSGSVQKIIKRKNGKQSSLKFVDSQKFQIKKAPKVH